MKVAPANQVPLITFLTENLGGPASGSQKHWVLDMLNLQGLEDWPKNEQRQARDLVTSWKHLFSHSNLDQGKMLFIKHQIELTDQTPFKECYQWIPPYIWWHEVPPSGDAGNSSIWKSYSPWASAVVLVQKKDRSWGSTLTSGNQTIRPSRTPTFYPTLMKPSVVCRDPNTSPYLTWGLGTGRSRWTRKANCWLHSH